MEKKFRNPLISEKVYKKLPNVLKCVTEKFSGREKDIVLTSSLGVLSSLLPNVYGYYGSDVVYPNLYTVILAPPASGKGVMMKSKILVDEVHSMIYKESQNLWNATMETDKSEDDDKKAKKDKEKVLKTVLKVVPANISSAELYNYMNSIEDGILMIESEADTLSNMLKYDWSNYSDILRKAFHHERMSLSRKSDGQYIFVDEPKLSLVLSGTPEQLKSLINSKENGLLSRLLIYSFNETTAFKDVFEKKNKDINVIFEKESQNVLEFYKLLRSKDSKIEFELTERQKDFFVKHFAKKHNQILTNESISFISNLHRLGLICFRICMILTVYREYDNLKTHSKLVSSNKDFIIAIRLLEVYYQHSLFNFKDIDVYGLSENDEFLLDSVDEEFTRSQILQVGKNLNIAVRTLDDKLKQWRLKRVIKKTKNGHYKKLI